MKNSRDWQILFSKNLNMKIAYDKNSGDVVAEDRAVYKKKEIEILNEHGIDVDRQLHICKKTMGGEVVKCVEAKIDGLEKLQESPGEPELGSRSWEKKQASLF